jgi:hypothetical protein
MVAVQSPARVALFKVFIVSGEFILNPMWTNPGMKTTAPQATTRKELDIFFKESVFFISGDILFFLRLFLTTKNSL